ncbi:MULTISPECIES: hypothetical protein [Chelativorans]|uniref:hypothetical protein n=1 Tax=Chelativorans TaxID=449972 RepID=UPI0012ED0E51|nr:MULTISPECIES: hypothetical protein [Chelativorans]
MALGQSQKANQILQVTAAQHGLAELHKQRAVIDTTPSLTADADAVFLPVESWKD